MHAESSRTKNIMEKKKKKNCACNLDTEKHGLLYLDKLPPFTSRNTIGKRPTNLYNHEKTSCYFFKFSKKRKRVAQIDLLQNSLDAFYGKYAIWLDIIPSKKCSQFDRSIQYHLLFPKILCVFFNSNIQSSFVI